MAEYAIRDVVPCEGDTVFVPPMFRDQLTRRRGNVWYRSRHGEPVTGQLCALDKQRKPTAQQLMAEPRVLVGDAAVVAPICAFHVAWNDEYDLEVQLDSYLVHVRTEESIEQHQARVERQRLVAATALAMARAIYRSTSALRRPPQLEQRLMLEESEVFLDVLLDQAGWNQEICDHIAAAVVYRGWPAEPSEGQGLIDRVVTWADQGGRSIENTRLHRDVMELWHQNLTHRTIPGYSLNGLREALGVAPTL